MNPVTIGIIGGSGLFQLAELTDREERRVETPFGDPVGTVRHRALAASAWPSSRGMVSATG